MLRVGRKQSGPRAVIGRCAGVVIESLESRCLLSGSDPLGTADAPLVADQALTDDANTTVATTTTLKVSTNAPVPGQSVVLTAMVVSADGSSPTGKVAFLEPDAGGGCVLANSQAQTFTRVRLYGTAALSAAGTASLTCQIPDHAYDPTVFSDDGVSPLAAGSHKLAAVYMGNGASLATIGDQYLEFRFLKPGESLTLSSNTLLDPGGLAVSARVDHDTVAIGAVDAAPTEVEPGVTYYPPSEKPLLVTFRGVYGGSRGYYTAIGVSLPPSTVGSDTAHEFSMSAPCTVDARLPAKLNLKQWNYATRTEPASLTAAITSPDGTFYSEQPTWIDVPGAWQHNSAQLVIKIPPPSSTTTNGGTGIIWNPVVGPIWQHDNPAPTGTVTFYDGDTPLGRVTMDSVGVGAFNRRLSLGTHIVKAVYSGDKNYLPCTSSITVTVDLARSSISLDSSAPVVAQGDSVTLTADVNSVNKDLVAPRGSVVIYEGQVPLASLTLGSQPQTVTLNLTPGPHRLTAVYAGDENYNPSYTSPITLMVTGAATPAAPLVTLRPTPDQVLLSKYGAATSAIAPTFVVSLSSLAGATLSRGGLPNGISGSDPLGTSSVSLSLPAGAKVNAGSANQSLAASTAAPASGTVIFFDGRTRLGQATMNDDGYAVFTPLKPLGRGKHSISAYYCGDARYAPGTSAVLQVENGAAPTSLAVSSTVDRTTKRPALTIAVSGPQGDRTRLTGTVVLREAGRAVATLALGADDSNAKLSLGPGIHILAAYYSGDALHRASVSIFTITV